MNRASRFVENDVGTRKTFVDAMEYFRILAKSTINRFISRLTMLFRPYGRFLCQTWILMRGQKGTGVGERNPRAGEPITILLRMCLFRSCILSRNEGSPLKSSIVSFTSRGSRIGNEPTTLGARMSAVWAFCMFLEPRLAAVRADQMSTRENHRVRLLSETNPTSPLIVVRCINRRNHIVNRQ
jgi:hypothetical protein